MRIEHNSLSCLGPLTCPRAGLILSLHFEIRPAPFRAALETRGTCEPYRKLA